MELRHLQHFVAVAEDQHFTRAAERLMVSQSGLSASIRALERELRAPLFVRTTRRVTLTEAGRALLAEAERILAQVRAAHEAVAAVQGVVRGTLSVGTEQCIAGVDVAGLLAAFRRRHPDVEIRLRQTGSGALGEEVAATASTWPSPTGRRRTPISSAARRSPPSRCTCCAIPTTVSPGCRRR